MLLVNFEHWALGSTYSSRVVFLKIAPVGWAWEGQWAWPRISRCNNSFVSRLKTVWRSEVYYVLLVAMRIWESIKKWILWKNNNGQGRVLGRRQTVEMYGAATVRQNLMQTSRVDADLLYSEAVFILGGKQRREHFEQMIHTHSHPYPAAYTPPQHLCLRGLTSNSYRDEKVPLPFRQGNGLLFA